MDPKQVATGTDLPSAILRLHAFLTDYQVGRQSWLPDLVLLNLAADALDHAKAAELLLGSEVPRAAFTCARATLEAAQDALLLVADQANYHQNGALVRAFEIIELEDLHYRRDKAFAGADSDGALVRPSYRDRAVRDAAVWDSAGGAYGHFLLDAYDQIKKDRRRHWSNLSRKAIAERVETYLAERSGLAQLNDALYGLLSYHAHPRSRTGGRTITRTEDGHFTISSGDTDREGPVVALRLGLDMALMAVMRRPTPDV